MSKSIDQRKFLTNLIFKFKKKLFSKVIILIMENMFLKKSNDKLYELLPIDKKLIVLEAGCGTKGYIQLPKSVYKVGIDISEKQLDQNNELAEKVLGDIQYFDFPENKFDVIVCWDVLEHLPHPELAINRFIG